jgi:WD40 repeat protein
VLADAPTAPLGAEAFAAGPMTLAFARSAGLLARTDGTSLDVGRPGGATAMLPTPRTPIVALAFDPSERRLAAACVGAVVVYDVATASVAAVLDSPGGRVNAVAYSPDGARIATASADGGVRIWHAETGVQLVSLRGHRVYATSLAWSPDGETLASGGGNAPEACLVRLWRARK